MLIFNENESYTLLDVALELKVKIATVRGWIRQNKLEGYKVNGRWRVTGRELQKFINAQREK